MWSKSFDNIIPVRVAISAISLMVFGMVIVGVICSVEIFVTVPIIIDIAINRDSGLIVGFVSLLGLWFIRGYPVSVRRSIFVL